MPSVTDAQSGTYMDDDSQTTPRKLRAFEQGQNLPKKPVPILAIQTRRCSTHGSCHIVDPKWSAKGHKSNTRKQSQENPNSQLMALTLSYDLWQYGKNEDS